MDATERMLREQAVAHGLVNWKPEPAEHCPDGADEDIRRAAERDEATLHSIAGLRGGPQIFAPAAAFDEERSSGSFTIGARWRGAAEPAPELSARPAVDLSSFDSAEALAEALGLDGLKAELARRGAKAGGSLEERAARLWRIRDLGPGADLPDDLKPKRRPRDAKKADKADAPAADADEKRKKKGKRKLGPEAPWARDEQKPRRRRPQVDTSKPPLIAAARFTKKEAAILDFVGSVPDR